MKPINIIRGLAILTIAAIATSSCSEKIDLKLNNSDPQFVIEGNLSDKPGPYYVILTKSKLFTDDNQITGIPAAQVVISDDAGNTDTLTEAVAGLYLTNSIQGTVGRTYRLQVLVEGQTFESYCKMPPAVDFDSIALSTETDFRGNVKRNADIIVRDPAGVQNQYRVVSTLNSSVSGGFNIHRDRLWDGKLRSFGVPQDDFTAGDTLTVDLWSIDEHIYTYFSQFNQNQNNFGAPAAPANPDPVYTPAALGYFSAHSVKSKTIIIPN